MLGLFMFIVGLTLLTLGLLALLIAARAPRQPPEPFDDVLHQRFTGNHGGRPVTPAARRRNPRRGGFLIATILISAGSLIIFFDSFTIVAPGSVAVASFAGHVRGEPMRSGWHWVRPWHDVTTFHGPACGQAGCPALYAGDPQSAELQPATQPISSCPRP